MTERRRRSRAVPLVAVPVLALAFTACGGNNDSAYCVDKSDRIVENQRCDDDTLTTAAARTSGTTAAARPTARFVPGTKISGGDRVSTSNVAENARRGGFGSSSKTSASGVGRSVASHSGGG